MSLTKKYVSPQDWETYQRVKKLEQTTANRARSVVSTILNICNIPSLIRSKGRAYLDTPLGSYRLAASGNSDNSTEQKVHTAQIVNMENERALGAFFSIHGIDQSAVRLFHDMLDFEMAEDNEPITDRDPGDETT